jgi:hypothetical protein
MTAIAGASVLAADFNTSIRDNLNQTAPALATSMSSWFPHTGTNALAERIPAQNNATGSSTTTSTSYGNLADTVTTSVTVSTGTKALVLLYTNISNSVNGNRTWCGYAISGATTLAAADDRSVNHSSNQGMRWGATFLETGLTAGSNTFTMRYRVTAGTGTFSARRIGVIPF